MKSLRLLEHIHAQEDEQFDLIYPPKIRGLSRVHWTPVEIARKAAAFLVRELGTRVLDVGCGSGKFCIVGALTTEGHFTGIEQRKHLCELARLKIEQVGIPNAEILHGNIGSGSVWIFSRWRRLDRSSMVPPCRSHASSPAT
jgi:tRNA G46 methylase TrmB